MNASDRMFATVTMVKTMAEVVEEGIGGLMPLGLVGHSIRMAIADPETAKRFADAIEEVLVFEGFGLPSVEDSISLMETAKSIYDLTEDK